MRTRPLASTLAAVLLIAVCTFAQAPADAPKPAAADAGSLYVAVGYGGRRMSSRDGGVTWENHTQWSDKAADNDDVLFNVAFGKGKFVAVGGGAKIGHILVTRDGKESREMPQQRGRVATVAFGNDRFVAGHGSGFLYSLDGEEWKAGGKLDFKGSVHFRKSVFGNGLFVAIGDCDPSPPPGEKSKRVSFRASTKDGEKVASFAPDTPVARAIAFGAGRFVVVGPNGLRESSADGKTWEHRAAEPGEDLNSVVWTGKQFIASGWKWSYTSPDGVTWKKQEKGIPCTVLHASADGGTFIGASWGGNIWRSTDGVTWKKQEIPPGPSFEAVGFGAPTR